MKFVVFPETPVVIIVPLKETEVLEGDSVTLTCEVNIPDLPVRWFKDNVEIFPMEERQQKTEGTIHTLTIPKATLEDEAEYTVWIGGKKSKALLLVEGWCAVLCFLWSHVTFYQNHVGLMRFDDVKLI